MPEATPHSRETAPFPRPGALRRVAKMLEPARAEFLASALRNGPHPEAVPGYIEDDLDLAQADLDSAAVTGRSWEMAGHRTRLLQVMDPTATAGNGTANGDLLRPDFPGQTSSRRSDRPGPALG